jgi:integrase
MARLRELSTRAAAALEWTILSVARTDETLGAPWTEIDVEKAMWTIPAVRMKVPADHRVPLTERMLDLLDRLPKGTSFVFSGENPKKKLPHEAMLKTVKAIRTATTVHGFRSTFRDWAAEQTAYPNDVVEMALAHKVAGKTEAAYLRSDMFEKRRRLMADWAAYCASSMGMDGSNVVPMRSKT